MQSGHDGTGFAPQAVRTRYRLGVTSWWAIVLIAAIALGSGVIGAVIGERVARRDADDWPEPLVPMSYRERNAAVYLDVAVGWHTYLESVRPLAFPGEGFAADRPRDLAAVLRARAQLEQVGTIAAQQLHDEALEAAVTLINVLRSLPTLPTSGAPDLSGGRRTLRAALRDLATRVDRLERQMNEEIQPAAQRADPEVEITGRTAAARRPVAGHRPDNNQRR
jgi:hypothetical protein